MGGIFLSVPTANIKPGNLFFVPLCGGPRATYWADVGSSPGTANDSPVQAPLFYSFGFCWFPCLVPACDALISDEIGRVRGALAVHSDAYISNDL